jgi:lysophospholipase L1-like esterase
MLVMNIVPVAIKVLCFGDSNTWGYTPKTKQRYPVGVRWTSLLQKKLGNDYWIIEEGLNGRTTNIDDPVKVGKNGLTYLIPCLETHNPIDVLILFLGTNDLKERYHRSAQQIAEAINNLVEVINQRAVNKEGREPRILLVSPPLVNETVAGVEEKYKGAESKSRQLGSLYQAVAEKYNLPFVDLLKHVEPSLKDGYHLEPESHAKVAEIFFEKIRKL